MLEETAEYKPGPLVAHLRRGDYTTTYANVFCSSDESAYTAAVKEHGWSDMVIHWVREDRPVEFKNRGLEYLWLIDFTTLMKAKVLFRANSTFSWWAATLGNPQFVYSPVVEGLRGHQTNVQFVSGNIPRCVDLPNVHNYHIIP